MQSSSGQVPLAILSDVALPREWLVDPGSPGALAALAALAVVSGFVVINLAPPAPPRPDADATGDATADATAGDARDSWCSRCLGGMRTPLLEAEGDDARSERSDERHLPVEVRGEAGTCTAAAAAAAAGIDDSGGRAAPAALASGRDEPAEWANAQRSLPEQTNSTHAQGCYTTVTL